MRLDVDAVLPLPDFATNCGHGLGLAACPALGLVVACVSPIMRKRQFLQVFSLPAADLTDASTGLAHLYTMTLDDGRPSPPACLKVNSGDGRLAFTGPGSPRPHLVLLTDLGADAVHSSGARGVRGCTRHHSEPSWCGGKGLPGGRQHVEGSR
jgi:hypothetical protein